MTAEKIAIIGAGLSGCVLARTLVDAGFDVTIFEKSGGTGGRLATRRTDFGAFNHGAQYLSAKNAPFRAMLTGLSRVGAVIEWAPEGKDRNGNWHIGAPGMSGLVKPLLKDVNVVGRTRICAVSAAADRISLASDAMDLGEFDRVIVTVPAPQAYDLLADFDSVFQSLASVRYAPCWTVMAVFKCVHEGPSFARGNTDGPIGWMAKSFDTQDRLGVVAQACAGWSRDHLELPKDEVTELVVDSLQTDFGFAKPIHTDAHRWRYALVEKPLGTAFLGCRAQRVFCSGDGMLGARAENAFESSRLLADHLKSEFGAPKWQ